jgi:hypothetical protein
MKQKIINVLKKYPGGLMAKEIVSIIGNTDKHVVNSILYSNMSTFEVKSYVWKLKNNRTYNTKPKAVSKTSTYGSSLLTSYNGYASLYSTSSPSSASYSSSNYNSSYSYRKPVESPRLELFVARKCVGNCSTCNRDHCVEDRYG